MAGLYIHIPFCRKACHYCDFHFSTNLGLKKDMVNAIVREIALQKDYLPAKNLQSIYFGGGTPSLLTEQELGLIFEAVYEYFTIGKDAEITLEANPDDLTKEKIKSFKSLKINRLSIGIQSFDDNHLKLMNRRHTAIEAENCVKFSQDSGIDNLSLDLIYGIPAENHQIWENDLQKAIGLNVKHISAYCLTIEPKTVFGNWVEKSKFTPVTEDFAATQFEMLIDFLEKNNFEQYEISNFSLPAFHARHNSNYWKQQPYLGIGPSAHSYNGFSRQWNAPHNQQYIKSITENIIPATIETLSENDRINEYVMTGLRTKWGINLEEIKHFSNLDFLEKNIEILKNYKNQDLLAISENTIILTKKGKLLADRIASDLFM